eukprot:TRINITY_DN5355_c0_g1_i1.p2 TRINITY_DN5355_c0_g1~~TRINITY_DN5355_c0_g1_i1.p2  ORF type:complete len:104 (-),score=27.63 TRINITY_DN5355_c0_g1_i1:338-622(-)
MAILLGSGFEIGLSQKLSDPHQVLDETWELLRSVFERHRGPTVGAAGSTLQGGPTSSSSKERSREAEGRSEEGAMFDVLLHQQGTQVTPGGGAE